MYPTLLDLGGFTLPSYFTFLMLGYALAVLLTWREGRRIGIDPDDVLDYALYALIWGVIGSRLLHVVADGFFMDYVHLCTDPFLVEGRDLLARPASELEALSMQGRLCTADAQCLASQEAGRDVGALCNTATGLCHPEQDCFRWAKFWSGGLAIYGGLLGATGFALYFIARYRVGLLWAPKVQSLSKPKALAGVPVLGDIARGVRYLWRFPQGFLKFADMAAPTVSLAQAFGRMGCFLAGCCFGQVTEHSVGMHFPAGSPAYQLHRKEHLQALMDQKQQLGEWLSLSVHPTQLYSAVGNFVIFLVLFFVVRRRKRFHGQVIGSMVVLYGVTRFMVEFYRADYRGGFMGLSTSQWISVPLLILAVWGLWRGWRASSEVIDDGASPPLGKPLAETVYQPEPAVWDGAPVAPQTGWRAELNALLKRIGAPKAALSPDAGADVVEPPPPRASDADGDEASDAAPDTSTPSSETQDDTDTEDDTPPKPQRKP